MLGDYRGWRRNVFPEYSAKNGGQEKPLPKIVGDNPGICDKER
jgi:hypothetical protein